MQRMLRSARSALQCYALAGLALATAAGCSTECDTFYDTYEACGYADPGQDVDKSRESCERKTDGNESCENDYKVLNACIDRLSDPCSYPEQCSLELEIAALRCNQ
jgi:hypothetical protein